MIEVGHASPTMTLGLYAQLVTIEAEAFGSVLGELVGRAYRALSGAQTENGAEVEDATTDPRDEKTPR